VGLSWQVWFGLVMHVWLGRCRLGLVFEVSGNLRCPVVILGFWF